jgi:hypothetical protein
VFPKKLQASDGPFRLMRLPAYEFLKCSRLRSVNIPRSVRVIAQHCFDGCSELRDLSFDVPATVRKIDSQAFGHCSNLACFIVTSSVSTLGESVFCMCSRLASLTFETPSHIANIPKELVKGCTALTNLTLPDSVIEIDSSAFLDTGITSVTAPGYVMCESLFMRLTTVVRCLGSPQSITIPAGVREIAANACCSVRVLKELNFEEGVEKIGAMAFFDCAKLLLSQRRCWSLMNTPS